MTENPTDLTVLFWSCEKCGQQNYPYGHMPTRVPAHLSRAKCEGCGYVETNLNWSDQETKILMRRAELGLPLPNSGSTGKLDSIEKELAVLQESRNADRQEMKLIRQLLDDLIQNKMKDVREGAANQEQLVNVLLQRVKELEDWKKGVDDKEHGR